MDFSETCERLAGLYPAWSERIMRLAFRESPTARPVDNDGQAILYNERLLRQETAENRLFYVAQQLLSIQLRHAERRGARAAGVWKLAGEAVVNAMLRSDGFTLPARAFFLPEAAELSAEAVYDRLILLAREDASEEEGEESETEEAARPDKQPGKESGERERTIDETGLAAIVAGLAGLLKPSLQRDFDWFEGRTIREGVLSYEFRAYPVACAEVLLDTSASVDAELLRAFVRGVKGLLRQDALVRVGCFDTRFYGFQDVYTEEDVQKLSFRGGGGTDFHAAVEAFTGDAENRIIFTDGLAEMPEQRCDAIWVVYGSALIRPVGGRVIYSRPPEEREKHEIDFLIT